MTFPCSSVERLGVFLPMSAFVCVIQQTAYGRRHCALEAVCKFVRTPKIQLSGKQKVKVFESSTSFEELF